MANCNGEVLLDNSMKIEFKSEAAELKALLDELQKTYAAIRAAQFQLDERPVNVLGHLFDSDLGLWNKSACQCASRAGPSQGTTTTRSSTNTSKNQRNKQIMKCSSSNEVIHKDVVIIGNGPSGITLSYMLSGNIPYVVSNSHPDEFLSARLASVLNKSLMHEDLEHLANGLEGRTTNPVSLLIDNLMHPCADIGLELEPLVEWRNDGYEVNGSSYLSYRIFIIFASTITYVHVICCLCITWTDWENPWIEATSSTTHSIRSYGPRVTNFTTMYVNFYYSACLMVFNSGYGLVSITNATLLFTVNVWICSRIIFILTLSYFMELYTVVQSSNQKYIDMVSEVKDCMKHKQIPEYLRKRILAYYDIKYQNYFFQESEILNTVSGQLKQEIVMNTCRKLVENVTFFKNLPIALLVRIVSCLRYEIFLTNDVIAKAGTPGDSMYFISNGTVAVFTRTGKEISHVVLGKGSPGGSWNSMDPQILTLSLGSWMALPGLPYKSRTGSETRASAKNVADYYKSYVKQMNLSENFVNNVLVTSIKPCFDVKCKWVERVNNDIAKKAKLCSRLEAKETAKCTFSDAISYLLSRNHGKNRSEKDVRKLENKKSRTNGIAEERFFNRLGRCSNSDKSYNPCDFNYTCDTCCCNKCIHSFKPRVPNKSKICDSAKSKWMVEVYDSKTRQCITYTCNYLVLANGSSDLPNRLNISNYKTDPYWLLYDLRSLEIELDLHIQNEENLDPVLIIGAGLSAADAIIATRARNVPVMHMFRNKSSNLSKQLPENMYPEYHKVHQMMKDESKYPLYTPLPGYTLTNIEENNRTVTLTAGDGTECTCKISFAVVLIGSRPDMSFLPTNYNLAMKKNQPLDCKNNTVNINKITHSVNGYESLYALGPLAGDNFVRFLPGGALAVLSDLYKKYELK